MLHVLVALLLSVTAAEAQTVFVYPNAQVRTHPGYIAGRYYPPIATPATGTALTADTVRCIPIIVFETITISELQIGVQTSFAGGLMQAAIYTNGANDRPAAQLGATADIDTSSTGVKNSAITPVQLAPGTYWTCANANNTTNAVLSVNPVVGITAALVGSTNIASSSATTSGVSATLTYGTWGDLSGASWSDITTAKAPIVSFRVSSVP